ncbi:MAG: CvpA family protein [Sedimentisphaerales bacterium]|jgi:hypothetical protein|nr:CvpA family protein [Sedimentisphaerales bacterium]NLT78399.1 CvpA family protein [Planctomycetota bacterium]
MVFWIAILVGGAFVWLGVRMGFYQSWCLLFNIVVSIYLAIFLAPLVADRVPTGGEASAYGVMLSLAALAGGCFALLCGVSYVFLTGQFRVPFPKAMDILAAGLLGFLSGFLVTSFVALVVVVGPLAQHKVLRTLGFDLPSQKANLACMAWCCDVIHSVVRSEPADQATHRAIDRLLDRSLPAGAASGRSMRGSELRHQASPKVCDTPPKGISPLPGAKTRRDWKKHRYGRETLRAPG